VSYRHIFREGAMMLKKISIMAFAVMTAISPAMSYAASGDDVDELRSDSKRRNEWIPVKNDKLKHIATWAKQEEGKTIRSFKVDMIVDANLETIARLHFDVENIKRWFWETKESRLLKKVSNKEYYYYQVFNAPLTIPDRDTIVHVIVEPFTAKKGFMALKLNAAPDFMPVQPGKTRVQAQDYYVKFTPIDKNTTRLEAEGYIDPGGVIPAWTINFVQRSAPYTSMLGLARMVQLPYYREGTGSTDFTYME
jgi:hypothetical protein